jgi:hypothetical protein
MNRKQFAATTVLFIGVSLPVLAVDQKPANSEQRYVPRLSDIMVATQLRHFKLWYAGIVQTRRWQTMNWRKPTARSPKRPGVRATASQWRPSGYKNCALATVGANLTG